MTTDKHGNMHSTDGRFAEKNRTEAADGLLGGAGEERTVALPGGATATFHDTLVALETEHNYVEVSREAVAALFAALKADDKARAAAKIRPGVSVVVANPGMPAQPAGIVESIGDGGYAQVRFPDYRGSRQVQVSLLTPEDN